MSLLHSDDDTTPGIHNPFAQRHDVVNHVVIRLVALDDIGRSFQHLGYCLQIFFEMWSNGVSYISETLQNSGLQLVAKGSILWSLSTSTSKVFVLGELLPAGRSAGSS